MIAGCVAGYYGYKCQKTCQCNLPRMDAECDHRNGQCYCEPGYANIYCNESKYSPSLGLLREFNAIHFVKSIVILEKFCRLLYTQGRPSFISSPLPLLGTFLNFH